MVQLPSERVTLSSARSGGWTVAARRTGPRSSQRHDEEFCVTYVITETCIGTQDKSCVDVCPVDCIHFEEGSDRLLYISPEECIDCGACEPACPVKAIYPED